MFRSGVAVLAMGASFIGGVAACGGGDGAPGPTFADDHPRIYLSRNRERLAAMLTDERPAAVRFRETVDLQLEGTDIYAFEAWYAALIGQLTGDPSYCSYAVDFIEDFVASEEATISSGGVPEVAGDSYLEIGDKVGDVLLVYDWCFDRTSTSQRTRWLAYAAQAVWNVWNHEEAQWGGVTHEWSGWSVNNPRNNYYYSFLRATMLFGLAAHGEHPDAEAWLTFVRDTKIGGELVPTFNDELVGGGSLEGTGYGVSMHRLWELYDLWQGSTGENIATLTPHTRASLLNMIHQTVPTLDRVAPIGDHARDSTAELFDYHRNYVGELAYLFQDDGLAARAKWYLSHSSVPEMSQRFMAVYDFLFDTPALTEQPLDGLTPAYYGSGTGQIYARSGWDVDASWLGVIAGPYLESHAHRDQGSFLFYRGAWLAYDANVESSSGIEQAEEFHNLVKLSSGGTTFEQNEPGSSTVQALARGDGWMHIALDSTGVYEAAEINRVQRELVFLMPHVLVVFDRVDSDPGTTQTWQLNVPSQPTVAGSRTMVGAGGHTLSVEQVVPASGSPSVVSWSEQGLSGGYRLELAQAGGANQFLHVLWTDNEVTAVAADNDGGRTGVTITLAGGGTATVRFGASGVDGTLDFNGQSVSLGAGVDAIAETE